jgi:hypothetical protein
MRKYTAVETIINSRRRQLGISSDELALATIGAITTWYCRMREPLTLKHLETQRIFRYLHFSDEDKEAFYRAMDELAEEEKV